MNDTQDNFDERHVATLFNEMADEYDQLEDEWYPHLYRQIEKVIRTHFPNGEGLKALDVGCGTGFQTLLLQSLGFETVGIDIARDLITRARAKSAQEKTSPSFLSGSAINIPFQDNSFDLINCCGSTLSLIPDYQRALAEMTRVLKNGGRMVLEFEQRWNLDLVWGLIDGLIGGRLGYEQSLKEAWQNISEPLEKGIWISYPFTRLDGTIDDLPLRCFTLAEIRQACEPIRLEIKKIYGVHTVTNLLPSTYLGNPNLHPIGRHIARFLAKVDASMKGIFPFSHLGCSAILILQKESEL
jgi:MPBQ/MSBQ methyltransferase